MFVNLNTGAIGIQGLALPEVIKLAAASGYEGIDFDIREAAGLAEAHGVGYVRDLFAGMGVRPGLWGLPVAWNQDQWAEELKELPRLAKLGRELGCVRTATWCPSWSDERDYQANWLWHIARYRAIAEVLRDEGCVFGIEFLGPKSLRVGHRYEFIHSSWEMMRLAQEIGTGNVGLLLDAWHLFTGGESLADLDELKAADVVAVHINDAPAGVPFDELPDTVRCLPLETGVLDLVGFLRKLGAMGYDGPLTVEPFNARINALAAEDPYKAAVEVRDTVARLWARSGL
jgi:sugar phosphate isomerase/epimerase